MGVVILAPRKRTPCLTLRKGGIIYVSESVVKGMPLPQRMLVEMDGTIGEIRLRPDPAGRSLSRWQGKPGAYLQVRSDHADSPLPFDGRSYPAKVCFDGSIVAMKEEVASANRPAGG